MKMNTLEKLHAALRNLEPEIILRSRCGNAPRPRRCACSNEQAKWWLLRALKTFSVLAQ